VPNSQTRPTPHLLRDQLARIFDWEWIKIVTGSSYHGFYAAGFSALDIAGATSSFPEALPVCHNDKPPMQTKGIGPLPDKSLFFPLEITLATNVKNFFGGAVEKLLNNSSLFR